MPKLPPFLNRWFASPLAPIAFALLGVMVFSSQDTLSKILVVDYSPFEVSWFRYTINMLVLSPMLIRSQGRVLRTRKPWIQVLRAVAVCGSAVTFMGGLGLLPIADATAINFVSPLLITLLSIPILGEKVGIRRWAAVIVGFAGVLVIVHPGGNFNAAALLPFASAALWAIGMINTRQLKSFDSGLTTLTYSTMISALGLTIALPFVWKPIDLRAACLLLVMGIISVLGQYLLILAYSRRSASVIAPLAYTQIIWSTLYGIGVFGTVPGLSTWIGGAIVVASGLYVLHRERVRRTQDD